MIAGDPSSAAASGLRPDEACYRTLFEGAMDGLLVADAATGRFLLGNERICRMLGCTSDELAGLSIADIHPPEMRDKVQDDFGRQLRGELPVALSIPVRRRDGTYFTADISARGTVLGGRQCVLGIFRDAGARLAAERALALSEAKLRQSQRLGGFGHYELDVESGAWTSSEALDDLFGIDADFGRSIEGWAALIHPDDRAGMVEYFAREVIGGRQPFDREYRILRHSDGAERWVHGVGELEVGPGGGVTRMFGVIQDVTARRLVEEERRRFEAGVQQTQKLESLGVLAGGIAHDFNNLLFCITGNADLALDDLPPGSPARESLLVIGQASRRAAEMCRQLLAYAGRSRVERRPVDLQALVADTDAMLSLGIPRSICLRREFAASLPAVEADASQLGQVLMNLVINAAEAIGPRNGEITIATGTVPCDRAMLDRSRAEPSSRPGDYAFLEVADDGDGMDPDTAARIFEPFFTTKFAGRGLGLAAVLGIVRGHGGGILVDSEPGRGTRMRVLLPAVAAGATPATAAADAAVEWRGEGTVLVVDDEAQVRAVARRYLERLGFGVECAGDGEEALALLGDGGDRRYACVLMDLTMPRLDGAATLQRMREAGFQVPVLLTSGHDEHDLAGRLAGRGVSGFVQKPYRQDELAARLRSALSPARPA